MNQQQYGIYIGHDSTVAVINGYYIAYLRLRPDNIAAILHHDKYGIVAVAYGFGDADNATAKYCFRHPDTGAVRYTDNGFGAYLDEHSNDSITYENGGNKLIYKTYDGRIYENILADRINMNDFQHEYPSDGSVAKRMAVWGQDYFFEYGDDVVNVGIDTQKYSIYYNFSFSGDYLYCRVGQNGYCERGRAMLSTICIRSFECRMIENNLDSIDDYRPDESCFAEGACAFPSDGGWYWSLSEVTPDVIRLNGCGGATYEIYRLHPWIK